MRRAALFASLMIGLAGATIAPDVVLAQVPPPPPPPPPPPMGLSPMPEPAAPADRQTGTGVILGRVVDAATGAPLKGVVVSRAGRGAGAGPVASEIPPGLTFVDPTGLPITPGSTPPERAITGDDGRFIFRNLPAGSFNLTTTLAGYLGGGFGRQRPDGPTRPVVLQSDERRTDVVIRLWKYGAITGTVMDETGEPAVGASVRALRVLRTTGRRRLALSGTAYTDDRGRFRFGSLTPGEYFVAIPSTTTTVPVASVAAYYEAMASGRTAELSRERSASGAPVPSGSGMRVGDHQIQLSSLTQSIAPPAPTPDGRVWVYLPVMHPESAGPESEGLVVRSGEERAGVTLRLLLAETVRLTGHVTGPDGPVGGIGVRLFPSNLPAVSTETGFETATTVTDAQGQFTFLGVAPGAYVVKVRRIPRPGPSIDTSRMTVVGGMIMTERVGATDVPATPVLWGEAPITVGQSNVDGISLTLREGAKVTGRVAFAGAGQPPSAQQLRTVQITLAPVDGPSTPIVPARVGEDGRFETAGHPPGRYTINGSAPGPGWSILSITLGGRPVLDEPIEVESSDLTDVVITYGDRTTTLGGTVQGAAMGAGVDAVVLIVPADYDDWIANGMIARRARQVSVARTGTYTTTGLRSGDYLVAAVAADAPADLQDPEFVRSLARVATRVTLVEGDTKQLALRLSSIPIR